MIPTTRLVTLLSRTSVRRVVLRRRSSLPEFPRQNHYRWRVGSYLPPANHRPASGWTPSVGISSGVTSPGRRPARRIDVEVDGATGTRRPTRSLVVVAVLDELRQRDPELVEAQARELARDELELAPDADTRSGRRTTPLTTLKTAVFAPMPSASVRSGEA